MILTLRTGFAVELLAPRAGDPRRLADEIARRYGGAVEETSRAHGEPASLPGAGDAWHLTRVATVRDAGGAAVCDVLDGAALTAHPHLQAHLDQEARPPGGRRVACSIVTPQVTSDHEARLEALLAPARDLGFTVPHEAAVHLRVDGSPFRSSYAFANLVRLFGYWREPLRALLGTDPSCTRLAALPTALLDLVEEPLAGWAELQEAAGGTGLTEHVDVDLTALLDDDPRRDVVGVRILPGALHASPIIARTALVEGLLARCLDPRPFPHPATSAVEDGVAELASSADSGVTAALPARRSPRLAAAADARAWAAPSAEPSPPGARAGARDLAPAG